MDQGTHRLSNKNSPQLFRNNNCLKKRPCKSTTFLSHANRKWNAVIHQKIVTRQKLGGKNASDEFIDSMNYVNFLFNHLYIVINHKWQYQVTLINYYDQVIKYFDREIKVFLFWWNRVMIHLITLFNLIDLSSNYLDQNQKIFSFMKNDEIDCNWKILDISYSLIFYL